MFIIKKNLILVRIERCSVVLRHANRLFQKVVIFTILRKKV